MLTALWQRLDRNPPLFFDDQLEPALAGARDQVFGMGLLRQGPPSRNAACPDCGYGCRIVWESNERTGARVAFISCRTCGPIEVEPDRLRQWAIDVPQLLAAVKAAGRISGPVNEVVEGHLWHLGAAVWGRRREAYFIRCAHEGVRARVACALKTHPKAVLFFPDEAAAHWWGSATDNPVVALESVVTLAAGGLAFDAAAVAELLADAQPGNGAKPTPCPKRSSRLADIARLTEAMVAFLRTARDHAFATEELTGTPELLPRPSKTQLAKETKIPKSRVTRCFKDKSARELKLYWKTAISLEEVMKFKGPISTGAVE